MIDFLLEIGFEEFPPSFLKRSAHELTAGVEGLLKDKNIFCRSSRTIYTPRRIGVLILGLLRKQKPQIVEIQGPPKKVAYTDDGKPTDTLKGFMKANGFKLTQISIRRTKKGEYVSGKKEIAGALTEDILYEAVPKIVESLEFPKTMVWNDTDTRFPRPVRWIVALLDRRPLRFEFGGVRADRYSAPNQHFSFKPIRLEKPREYLNFLRHGGVVVDPNERRKLIKKRIKEATARIQGTPVITDTMVEEINCVTEYPEAVSGEFDKKYLELPKEVLLTVFKNQGNLIWVKPMNRFVCVFSAKKKALQNVKKGYERVIAAKLYDAHFYYKNDLEIGLDKMVEQTKGMTWFKDLGTLYDKAVRLSEFAGVFSAVPTVAMKTVKRAAQLCKADLLSQMVREKDFTSLQGIMGGHYAKAGGEDEQVTTAIKEHYLPNFVGDELPSTREGAVLSIVDKIDSVVGAFLSGNRPTGSQDPLGVRRNGYGAVQLLDVNEVRMSVFHLVRTLLKKFSDFIPKGVDPNLHEGYIFPLFKERVSRYLEDKGYRYDEINAVLAVWSGDVVDSRKRCAALKKLRGKPEFAKLVIGQKRVRNILKGIDKVHTVDDDLIQEPTEQKLWQKGTEITSNLEVMLENESYDEALKLLLSMRSHIDKFFDDVMVMCDDKKLRNNRLALVDYINRIFMQFADFSEIVIEGEKQR